MSSANCFPTSMLVVELRCPLHSMLTSVSPVCFDSGTIASTLRGDKATIGARWLPNQTPHKVGSLVSRFSQSIETSAPGSASSGSIRRILGCLLILQLYGPQKLFIIRRGQGGV